MVMKMKIWFALWLALFPYLHEQRYPVQLSRCEKNHIVVIDDKTPFEITLFNLKIEDDAGWEALCQITEAAEQLEIEVDASTQVSEPLPVYLFADDKLVQQSLIEQKHAYTPIHNPEYHYEKELLALEEELPVMADATAEEGYSDAYSQGPLFLLFIFLSWLGMVAVMVFKYKQIDHKTPFTKS